MTQNEVDASSYCHCVRMKRYFICTVWGVAEGGCAILLFANVQILTYTRVDTCDGVLDSEACKQFGSQRVDGLRLQL